MRSVRASLLRARSLGRRRPVRVRGQRRQQQQRRRGVSRDRHPRRRRGRPPRRGRPLPRPQARRRRAPAPPREHAYRRRRGRGRGPGLRSRDTLHQARSTRAPRSQRPAPAEARVGRQPPTRSSAEARVGHQTPTSPSTRSYRSALPPPAAPTAARVVAAAAAPRRRSRRAPTPRSSSSPSRASSPPPRLLVGGAAGRRRDASLVELPPPRAPLVSFCASGRSRTAFELRNVHAKARDSPKRASEPRREGWVLAALSRLATGSGDSSMVFLTENNRHQIPFIRKFDSIQEASVLDRIDRAKSQSL